MDFISSPGANKVIGTVYNLLATPTMKNIINKELLKKTVRCVDTIKHRVAGCALI